MSLGRSRRRTRPARVRCKACGSTRVRGIVDAYCDGRITLDADGQMMVESGSFEIHQEHAISPGSIICENCGHGEARIESEREEVVHAY